ncbi:hypothetical protein MHC_04130 [Mycoplasma haemocanis str. Illinois]|uniref:Uncharacterized protein n=1 Tax=Mycoplasma haemocanis (strain Illinois) TaxID=1111676 RepID=H6N7R0_MYCHN|nr:hypothetical protein [Mycoplasma haemocanis]AEW45682.1 hypothetical protein MHC_04130 [Mycoplasma haemocanis str. Illinois]
MMIFPTCGGVCAVGWYGFNSLQPKNLREYLEWQGFTLASVENAWKSIIKEHGELAKSIGVNSESDLEKLKTWCITRLPLSDFSSYIDKASKLCVDNAGTIEAKLVRDGIGLTQFFQDSSDDNKYKTSYAFRKHNLDFLSLISHTPEKGEKFEPAVNKYKKWCNSTLKAKPKPDLLKNFQMFCKPKDFTTIKKYLVGKEFLTEERYDSNLQTLHDKISNLASYLADGIERGKDGLKKWCNENLEKNFHESLSILDEILPKVVSRCVKDSRSDNLISF